MTADDPVELGLRLSPASRLLVVIDFDGTLAPIVPFADDAAMLDAARPALSRLAERTDVAIVSGRHLDDLSPRVQDLPLTLVGGHGTEVATSDGQREVMLDHDELASTLDAVEAELSDLLDLDAGWWIERKPASIAVHHRNVDPELAADRLDDVRSVMDRHLHDEPGWRRVDGKSVSELGPEGVDKGSAVRWLVERTERDEVLVIGDDVTDEDGFAAAAELGGTGVLVATEDRETFATHRVERPADVVQLLEVLGSPDVWRTGGADA